MMQSLRFIINLNFENIIKMQEKVAQCLAPEGGRGGVPQPSSWSYGAFHPNSRFFNAGGGPS
jgi:hypothetical protein